MTKSSAKRKTHRDKFPLTLHKTGQYCKKIRGKLHYFGKDKQEAFRRYLEQGAYLHTGKAHTATLSHDQLSRRTLCNLYLDHQESRAEIGEIRPRRVSDQILLRQALHFHSALHNILESDVVKEILSLMSY
jgi:hypothetical protein